MTLKNRPGKREKNTSSTKKPKGKRWIKSTTTATSVFNPKKKSCRQKSSKTAKGISSIEITDTREF